MTFFKLLGIIATHQNTLCHSVATKVKIPIVDNPFNDWQWRTIAFMHEIDDHAFKNFTYHLLLFFPVPR